MVKNKMYFKISKISKNSLNTLKLNMSSFNSLKKNLDFTHLSRNAFLFIKLQQNLNLMYLFNFPLYFHSSFYILNKLNFFTKHLKLGVLQNQIMVNVYFHCLFQKLLKLKQNLQVSYIKFYNFLETNPKVVNLKTLIFKRLLKLQSTTNSQFPLKNLLIPTFKKNLKWNILYKNFFFKLKIKKIKLYKKPFCFFNLKSWFNGRISNYKTLLLNFSKKERSFFLYPNLILVLKYSKKTQIIKNEIQQVLNLKLFDNDTYYKPTDLISFFLICCKLWNLKPINVINIDYYKSIFTLLSDFVPKTKIITK